MTTFTVHRLTVDLVAARFAAHFPSGFILLQDGDAARMNWVVQVNEEVGFRRAAEISADLKSCGALTVLTSAA